MTEAHWQQLLRERDAQGKLRQKEYADSKRSTQYSDIGEGDHNLEPLPYKVVEKKGNVVLIQNQEGNTKLRNASHMKKFIQPEPANEATEVHEGDEEEDIPTGRQLETTALTPPTYVDKQPTLPPESSVSALPSRPTRVRRPLDSMDE